jgi:hypothetical protein
MSFERVFLISTEDNLYYVPFTSTKGLRLYVSIIMYNSKECYLEEMRISCKHYAHETHFVLE